MLSRLLNISAARRPGGLYDVIIQIVTKTYFTGLCSAISRIASAQALPPSLPSLLPAAAIKSGCFLALSETDLLDLKSIQS